MPITSNLESRQTQLAEDSVGLTSIAASGIVTIQPASGETDIVSLDKDDAQIDLSQTDGTNNSRAADVQPICSNASNTAYTRINNADGVSAHNYWRAIITMSEET